MRLRCLDSDIRLTERNFRAERSATLGAAAELATDSILYFNDNTAFGPYEELYSMVQNKMATTRLALEICASTSVPERADVGNGPGREVQNGP